VSKNPFTGGINGTKVTTNVMNVYFLSDTIYIRKRLSILCDIFKIRKIINFDYRTDQLKECDHHIDNSMLLYKAVIEDETNYDVIEKMVKQAVYTFNSPICKVNGEGGFTINDKYKNSNARNPIHNLEYCDDDNVLVLCHCEEDFISSLFTKYSINILKKYAPELHYENKICFLKFKRLDEEWDFRSNSYVFYQGNFKSLCRFIPQKNNYGINLELGRSYSIYNLPQQYEIRRYLKEIGIYYDPVISYLNIKLKELYPKEIKDKDILFFLYGEDIFNTEFEKYVDKLEDDKEEMRMRCYDSTDDTSWANSEMEYIMNNGGDWITY